MPTFPARRHRRRLRDVGTTEKWIGLCVLLLTAAIVAGFIVQVATDDTRLFDVAEAGSSITGVSASPAPYEAAASNATASDNPFPGPGVDGWLRPRRVSRYLPENLYVKINGRAPVYVESGVTALVFGTYRHKTDGHRTIDVYWYHMGAASNAYALYQAEAPPGATPVSVGSDGYQIGGAVFFCKGQDYVQVLPSSVDADDARAALAIAESVAGWIKEDAPRGR